MPSEHELFEDSRTKEKIQCERGFANEPGEQIKSDSTLRDSVRFKNNASRNNENLDLTEIAHEQKFFFVCQRCDMLVREEDDKCQFCGADFLSMDDEDETEEVPDVKKEIKIRIAPRPQPPDIVEPILPELTVSYEARKPETLNSHRAGKVNVIKLLQKNREIDQDLDLYSGGTSQAHSHASILLKNTERIIDEAIDFGADVDKAKKYVNFARKAFKQGKMNQAISLCEKSRSILTPTVTCLIKGQISCLREAMIEMKNHGKTLAPMIVEMKTIQRALKDSKLDKAMEQTKTLMTETRKAQKELAETTDFSPKGSDHDDPRSCIGSGI